jgi:dTDP-4-amino-4,6-dideoxygalactose transaminase
MTDRVPFLDLVTPHRELKTELVSVFTSALHNAAFVGGASVDEFERAFAQYCGVEFAVGVSNGTDALKFALLAAGVAPGDAVITVPNTFAATVEAILQAGARPLFVDVKPRTLNMDVVALRNYLDSNCRIDDHRGCLVTRAHGLRVKAIVPVHLFGQPADMDPILELSARYQLEVIEDACQAHGARYFSEKSKSWHTAGSIGTAAAFSFYPGKNLGACGEAGAVTTHDERIAQRIRMLRDHGQPQKYYHEVEGFNGRLDAIQAGILGVKLKHLAAWNDSRRQIAKIYDEFLSLCDDVVLTSTPSWAQPVFHLYVIRVPYRDELRAHLSRAQIDTGIHYPIPLHLQAAFVHLGYQAGDFPVTETAAAQIVSLPMWPQLRKPQQQRVCEEIRRFIRARKTSKVISRDASLDAGELHHPAGEPPAANEARL